MKRGQRKEEILQTLARLLEDRSGAPITTARLAAEVGVSEAALYRHFPSKAKMYDALVDFIESSIFPRITTILSVEKSGVERCRSIAELILIFAASNPGLTRILTGHALVGEHERLLSRVNQILGRLELQFKQVIREAEAEEGLRTQDTLGVAVGMLTAFIDGKLMRYVRSHFSQKPNAEWGVEWPLLQQAMFRQSN
jgi:TetR/AcrR family transcriptional regulator